MIRRRGPFAWRRGDRSSVPAGRRSAEVRPADVRPADEGPDSTAAEGLLVEDHDGLLLLRTPSDNTLTPADVADLARGTRTDDGTVTVIAGAEGMDSAAFWPRLSELLDSLSESGADTVRLVMAGAGQDAKDRPGTARRIADAWGFAVKAPDGAPLVVPGGSLFVPPAPSSDGKPAEGGWWRFAPGAEPEPLGPRSPEPSWQLALRDVPSGTAGGSVVEHIPAGLLVRPAGAPAAQPGDLYHAVPVDPRRPAVVIGVPYGEDVAAEEVAEVLAALPEEVRSGVRLAPGGRRDVLRLAQSVCDRLETDVEVMTGLPLIAAAGPLGSYSVRSVLAAPDGTPTWLPFVDAVVCRPPDGEGRARPPRLLRWSPPLPGPAHPETGVTGLTDRWQVTVTRAGLWVGPRGGPPLSPTARQVDPGGPVIELGMPGELMDASLAPALSRLLGALTPALRERATLHVHGVTHDGGRGLRQLAAQHRLRTLRYAAPAPAPARARPTAQGQALPARTAAAAPPAPMRPAATGAGQAGAAASVGRPEPGQGTRTQSAQPSLPGRPAQAAQPRPEPLRAEQPGQTAQSGQAAQPGRPGLPSRPLPPSPQGPNAGIGPGRPAEGAGRAARAERARQLREAMAGAVAGANEPSNAGVPGRAPGTGTTEGPDGPRGFRESPAEPGRAGDVSGRAGDPPGRAGDPGRSGGPGVDAGPVTAEGPARPGGGATPDGRGTGMAAGTEDGPAATGAPAQPAALARTDASTAPGNTPPGNTRPGNTSAGGSSAAGGGAGSSRAESFPVGGSRAEGSPTEGSRAEGLPADGLATEGFPRGGFSGGGTPAESISAGDSPAESVSAEGSPAEGTRSEGTPAESVPAEGTRSEGAPAEGTRSEGTPAEGTPAEGTPAEGTRSEGAQSGVAHAGDAPSEDTPAADAAGPSAEGAPAAEPAGDLGPDEPEASGRPEVVPPPTPMRVASGTPADPAPARPPASPGAMASGDVPSEEPDALEEPGRTGTATGGTGEPDEAGEAAESSGPSVTPDPSRATDIPDAPGSPGTPDAAEEAEADQATGEVEATEAEIPQAPLPPVPFDPGHRSSEVERTAFRTLAEGMWDRHGAAVARSLARMPALRGKEQEAARADLIALRMYLHVPEGPLSHGALTRALREYEPNMLPYGACVASALTRLPSYRGAVLRGTGSDPVAEGPGAPALPRPGTLLRDAAVLSTTPFDPTGTATVPGGSYVIWSVAGRRVRQLSDHGRGPDEVVFAPGTLFRVLDVRRDGQAVQIYLRELTGPAMATKPDPDVDRAVLARLDDVVRGRSAVPAGTGHWPERCVGAVGAGP
ncbi:hypothetical protein AB0G71_16330 [Streptomyces sp. NPDC020403]|uniref:hypothetical protein n=1 Tax=unclassified Streptomyces TaxID=2593676 RepID=UPI0034037CC1